LSESIQEISFKEQFEIDFKNIADNPGLIHKMKLEYELYRHAHIHDGEHHHCEEESSSS
jgi:hypothetical protein